MIPSDPPWIKGLGIEPPEPQPVVFTVTLRPPPGGKIHPERIAAEIGARLRDIHPELHVEIYFEPREPQ